MWTCELSIKFERKGRGILWTNPYFGEFPLTPSWWLTTKCIFKGWSIALPSGDYYWYGTRYIYSTFGVNNDLWGELHWC
jgi:hypothetical protein